MSRRAQDGSRRGHTRQRASHLHPNNTETRSSTFGLSLSADSSSFDSMCSHSSSSTTTTRNNHGSMTRRSSLLPFSSSSSHPSQNTPSTRTHRPHGSIFRPKQHSHSIKDKKRYSTCGSLPLCLILIIIGASWMRLPALQRQWSGSPTMDGGTMWFQDSRRDYLPSLTPFTTATTTIARPRRDDDEKTVRFLVKERNVERRARTRPPPLAQPIPRTSYESLLQYPLKAPSQEQQQHWKPTPNICGGTLGKSVNHADATPLDSNSRVLISSVFSPVGVQLALYLNQVCGVQSIYGMDPLVPNTVERRMQRMQYYALLQKQIPHLQFLGTPYVGEWHLLGHRGQLKDTLRRLRPTHLVHLASTTTRTENVNATAEDRLYARHDRLAGVYHLMEAVSQQQQQQGRRPAPQILIYWPDMYLLQEAQVISNTYAKLYGISSVTLHLQPRHILVGDFGATPNDLWETAAQLLNVTSTNPATRSPPSSQSSSVSSYLWVPDVVEALVAGLQVPPRTDGRGAGAATVLALGTDDDDEARLTRRSLEKQLQAIVQGWQEGPKDNDNNNALSRHETPPLLRQHDDKPTTTTTTSGQSLSFMTQQWLGWTATNRPSEVARSILADVLYTAHPYDHSRLAQSHVELLSSSSLHPARTTPQHFPCASECAAPDACHASSVFGPDLLQFTKEQSRGCKFVVYMANFDGTLQELPHATSPNVTEEDSFCHFALVSSTSPLAERLVRKHYPPTTNATTTTTTQSSSRTAMETKGWKVILVPGTADTMSEAEYMLPKLSPGKFFSAHVACAVYVDPTTLPLPLGISWGDFIFRTIKTLWRSKRKGIYRVGLPVVKWVDRPVLPARRVALYVPPREAPPPDLPRPKKRTELSHRAHELLASQNVTLTSSIETQLEFYNHAAQLVQAKDRRSWDLLRNTLYPSFPFEWVNSKVLLHNLREDEARLLRCEWYDEHTFWGNRQLEDLSLGHVLARRKVLHKHEPPPVPEPLEPWTELRGKDAVQEKGQWVAIRAAADKSAPRATTVKGGGELFVRILDSPA